MPDPIITARIPQELYDKVKEKAKRDDITLSQVLRRLLREWIEEGERQKEKQEQN